MEGRKILEDVLDPSIVHQTIYEKQLYYNASEFTNYLGIAYEHTGNYVTKLVSPENRIKFSDPRNTSGVKSHWLTRKGIFEFLMLSERDKAVEFRRYAASILTAFFTR